jgi:hypothetical protein
MCWRWRPWVHYSSLGAPEHPRFSGSGEGVHCRIGEGCLESESAKSGFASRWVGRVAGHLPGTRTVEIEGAVGFVRARVESVGRKPSSSEGSLS